MPKKTLIPSQLASEKETNKTAVDPEILEADNLDDTDADASDMLAINFADEPIDMEFNDDITNVDEENSNSMLPIAKSLTLPYLPRISTALNAYLQEISKFPLLNPDEEYSLAMRVRDQKDKNAAFRLISSHLRLVVRIAFDFQKRWMQNVMDLIQEGNVGLMHAINKFDPAKGIKFSYYATFWIRAYILKFIMDNWRLVKIGTTQDQRKLFYNLNKEQQMLISHGFDPDAEMLANRLGVDKKLVIEMQQRLDTTDMSLDSPVNTSEDGGATHIDFVPSSEATPDENYAKLEISRIIKEKLKKIIPQLSEKEVYILENRILNDDPIPLREIGEKYNITRERVRQIETRLLKKIKTSLGNEINDFETAFSQKDE